MKYLSLCSGIEAASVAWPNWEPVAFSEIDPFPSAVLKHRFPHVPNWGDMTKFEEWPYVPIDAICGGTPCQSFSVAGLRKGLDDPRGNLMLTFGHILGKYRPTWFIWENVPGVLSSESGRDFASFLELVTGQIVAPPKDDSGWRNAGAISGIDSAYGCAWRVLDAQYTRSPNHPRAVPQRRRRVFVVGHLGDWRRAAAVLFDSESLSRDIAPRRQVGQRVAGTLKGGSGERGYPDPSDGNGGGLIEVAPTIRAGASNVGPGHGARSGDSKDELIVPVIYCSTVSSVDARNKVDRGDSQHLDRLVAHSLTANGIDASEDGTGRGTPLTVAFMADDYKSGGYEETDSARPLTTSADRTRAAPIAATTMAVRRLTPLECERLQAFPDGWTTVPVKKVRRERLQSPRAGYSYREIDGEVYQLSADGPRYKAIGNSMATNVMEWIGLRIQQVNEIVNFDGGKKPR